MNESIEATGQVICQILRDRLSNVQDGVKFYFQSIQPESIAHAVSLIETDPILKDVVELHLSESVFSSLGVSTEYLTTGAVGDYRNEELQSGKKIMLLGPPNESEWDTIHMMKQFGDEFIRSSAMAWVRVFAPATMDDVRKKWWGAALQGLNSLAFADTDQFALYVYRTSLLLNQGKLLTESLGTCLPALRLPCHSGLFSINENLRGQASKWKAKFLEHKRKAQCYLLKKNRNDDCIERDSLDAALTEYLAKPEPNIALADCFRAFIKAEYGWTDASASIAQYEWNVVSPAFFEKVASKAAQNLGSDTIALFDGRQEMRDLTEDERTVLKQLSESRGKGDPTEQEKAFFKSNYREIQADQPLFSRWESYILEKSVEDHDFIGGLIRCLRILSPKTGSDKWQMVVKAKAVKPKDLYQISEDVGLYFATRYGGLSALLSGSVKFVGFDSIFDYPKLIAQWKNDKKTQKKLRTGRPTKDSCKLVFYVELESDNNRQIKLVWRFNPESLAANLRADMTRLSVAANPFVATSVSRETSGRRALPLDLADISCLQPAYGHTAGTLVPPTDKLKSVSVIVKLKSILTAAVEARHLSLELKQAILSAHDAFVASYKDALGAFLEVGLFSHDKVEKAAVDYGEMLNTAAAAKIPDIILGQSLPLLLSGATVEVETYGPLSQPVVIIPPWHPLRLLAATSKAKQFAELAKDITSGSATMSDLDGELLFRDATEWLNHVYYPEVVLGGPQGCLPQLLSVCQYLQDYSVHELPVKDKEFDTPTDVNPRASAQQIGTIVGHYLDLQPHERDNLSVVLFDCDSEQLPGAVVDQIRTLSEDEEQDAMCQVLLAHSNKTKLRALYRTLSKAGESVDDFNSSEATRDFMARLRINIMVAENGKASHNLPQPYDIVFAESTISRHASQS